MNSPEAKDGKPAKSTIEELKNQLFKQIMEEIWKLYLSQTLIGQLRLISSLSKIVGPQESSFSQFNPDAARKIREDRNISLSQLAEILGIKESAMSRWENGSRVPRSKAGRRYREWVADPDSAKPKSETTT